MRIARWHGRRAVLLLVGVAAAHCAAPSETPRQPPKIAVDGPTHDFGTVEQGSVLGHTFTLHNAGGSDLHVDNVKSACGCTTVVRPVEPIAPGGAATVQAKCEVAKAFGPRTLTIMVYSNDPAQPTTALTLRAEVVADVAADPPEVYVGRARRGQQLDVPLRVLTRPGGPTIGLRLSKPDGAVLRASMPGPTPGQTERSVSLAIQATAPLGRFTEPVVIDTSSATYPKVSAQVTGIVDGDLTALPRELRFGAVPRGDAPTRDVVLRNYGDVPARVIGAAPTQPVARVQIDAVQEGREYHVHVSLYGGLPPGRIQTQLRIQTNRPEQPEIVIPMSAVIREKK